MNEPSVHEANKLLRVLTGEKLKYTIRVTHPDGKVTEFQSGHTVKVKWNEETRSAWIHYTSYEGSAIMPWVDGMVILTEENPK